MTGNVIKAIVSARTKWPEGRGPDNTELGDSRHFSHISGRSNEPLPHKGVC